MGKPRVRGSHAVIRVNDQSGNMIDIGEVNKFSVKELGELKKSRAIGEHAVTSTKTFEGYDLSFEGGKVDWHLAQLLHKADDQIYTNNARTPYFQVTQKIYYYNGITEVYTYNDVTIHGYNMDIDANDEITEKFEGFCGTLRTLSKPVDSAEESKINDKIKALIASTLKDRDVFGGNT
jgi:hypothetical protein